MRAAELIGIRKFRVVESETAPPASGEVQVRVAAVGICGSDLHNFTEGGIGDSPCRFPMVLGHEPSGVVLRTGSAVTGIQPGDHFALEPGLPCGICEMCRRDRANLCENMRFMSSSGIPGFFQDAVNLPAHNLIPVPPHVGLKAATLVEPLAVALHSLSFARIEPGETAVVFGAGPIGLLTIAALKLAGAGRVFAVEPMAHRRDGRGCGAEYRRSGAGDPRRYFEPRGGCGVRLRRGRRHREPMHQSAGARRTADLYGDSARGERAFLRAGAAQEGNYVL